MLQPFSGNQSSAERPSLSIQHHCLRSGSTETAPRYKFVGKGFTEEVLPRKTIKGLGEARQKRAKAQPGCCSRSVPQGSSRALAVCQICLCLRPCEPDFHTATLFSHWPTTTLGKVTLQVLKALYMERQRNSSRVCGQSSKRARISGY